MAIKSQLKARLVCLLLCIALLNPTSVFANASTPKIRRLVESSSSLSQRSSYGTTIITIATTNTNSTNATKATSSPTESIVPAPANTPDDVPIAPPVPVNPPSPSPPTATPAPTKKYEPAPDDDEEKKKEEEKKEGAKVGFIFLWIVVSFSLIWVLCYFRDAIAFFVGSVSTGLVDVYISGRYECGVFSCKSLTDIFIFSSLHIPVFHQYATTSSHAIVRLGTIQNVSDAKDVCNRSFLVSLEHYQLQITVNLWIKSYLKRRMLG